MFAALDLVELGAGQRGAPGGLLLIEGGPLASAVEVVGLCRVPSYAE